MDGITQANPTDEWLKFEVDFGYTESDTIAVTVYNQAGDEIATVSAVDEQLDSGGIRWYANGSPDGVRWYDRLVIEDSV